MTVPVKWSVRVEVDGQVPVTAEGTIDAEGWDFVKVPLPKRVGAASKKVDVDVQPGASDQLRLVLIRVEKPEAYVAGMVQFSTEGDAATSTMDVPAQLMLGSGAAKLVPGGMKRLVFWNTSNTEDAEVSVLVCRDATPDEPAAAAANGAAAAGPGVADVVALGEPVEA